MPLDKPQNVPNPSLLTPYITVDGNVAQLGTAVSTSYSGNTAARPTTARLGDKFYNTQLNQLEIYTTNGWVADSTGPQAPTNVTAANAAVAYGGTPAAIINFVPATSGNPAATYTVTSTPGSITATGTSSPITVPGLTGGTSYTFTVTATNTYGSATSTASGALTAGTISQPPTIGTATITTNVASVAFTAPSNTGASPVTSYTVYSTPGNIVVSGTASPISVPSLSLGTSYTFAVVANNNAGTSTLSAASNAVTPSFGLAVDVLVVAGGGGGGCGHGGGGGAGGYRTFSSSIPVNSSLSVVVGGAGAASTNPNSSASSGTDSSFNGIVSSGGGGGGSRFAPSVAGGSGGGGSYSATGSAGNTPATSPSQGNNGGNTNTSFVNGGGGGGATQAGFDGSTQGAVGGAGGSSSITGTLTTYAGGGGGGGYNSAGGAGGAGGGGAGGSAGGSPATFYGGGGGGGAYNGTQNAGGNGYGGVVIIKYAGGVKASGGTISSFGGNTIHTFTTNGTFALNVPEITTTNLVTWLDASPSLYSYPGSGTTWFDISGNGNNATLYNGVSYNSTSGGGQIMLDNSNGYIQLASNSSAAPYANQSFTVDMWVYRYANGRNYEILWSQDYTSHTSPYYSNHIRMDNDPGSINAMGGYSVGTGNNASAVTTGVWQHWVVTRDSATGNNYMYKNGSVLASTLAQGGTITYYTNPLWVGKSNFNASSELYFGSIRYYNRALTAAEVATNFNSQKSRFGY
jgi:hypothetical protein